MHTEQVTELYVWTGLQQPDTSGPECLDGFQKFTNYECGGNDVDNYEIDWTSVADLQSCAAHCTENPDCESFNFGHPGNGQCWLKTGLIAPTCGSTNSDWDFYNKVPGANSCVTGVTPPPMNGILCPAFTHFRIKLTNYIQTSCGCGAKNAPFAPFCAKSDHFYQDRLGTNIGKALKKRCVFAGPNHGTGSGTCTPGNMDIDYWCMSEMELFDERLRPIDTTSVVATADSNLCDSTAGITPAHCENWDPMAVFDGGDQDYCSAAVAPGTRVPDFEGKLGYLAIQFANPEQISSYTMGAKNASFEQFI
jgi:hypothetical protein